MKINKECPQITDRGTVTCTGYEAENHSSLCRFKNRDGDCENKEVHKIWICVSMGIVRKPPGYTASQWATHLTKAIDKFLNMAAHGSEQENNPSIPPAGGPPLEQASSVDIPCLNSADKGTLSEVKDRK